VSKSELLAKHPVDPAIAARESGQVVPEQTPKAPRVRRSRAQQPRGPPTYDGPPLVFTIKTFCLAHHLSEARFHELRAEGIAPALMRIGRRVYITVESAATWRAEREAATAKVESANANAKRETATEAIAASAQT
jgi:hypothetical protein